MEAKPRRPAHCELDYGRGSSEMNAEGPTTRLPHGKTCQVNDESLPVLGYGEVWHRG